MVVLSAAAGVTGAIITEVSMVAGVLVFTYGVSVMVAVVVVVTFVLLMLVVLLRVVITVPLMSAYSPTHTA